MTIYSLIFYLIAAVMIIATAMAVMSKNMVHAVLHLVISFVGSALLFFLLGAPLLAVLQVIVYAGAIMILFLFIVMMISTDHERRRTFSRPHFFSACGICGLCFLVLALLIGASPDRMKAPLRLAVALPQDFGRYLFSRHWLAIESISMLLLVVLVGVLILGVGRAKNRTEKGSET